MGNLCCCFKNSQDGPNPKTPLLTSAQPPGVTTPPEKYDSTTTSVKATATTASGSIGPNGHATTGQSARVHKPEENKDDFVLSIEEINKIEVKPITTVPSLDKTFQDHAKLFNDLHTHFMDLRQSLHNFKAHFEQETAGIPVISDCLTILAKRCGVVTLSGTRTKNCIQIECDRGEICEKCEASAEDVLDTIDEYNKANRLIRSLLEKSPKVQSSLRLVLEEEANLKREVTKADPDGKMGPEPLRAATENFSRFHKLPAQIDKIQQYTNNTFKEIASGSKVLFVDST